MIKGDTNHWWAVMNNEQRPMFLTAANADEMQAEYSDAYRLDYCGQQCVTTVFNRWLSDGSVLRQPAPAPEIGVVLKKVEPDWFNSELNTVEAEQAQKQELGDELNAWDATRLDPLNTRSTDWRPITTSFTKVAA